MADRYMFKIRMNTLGRQYTEIKPCFVETAFRIYVKTAGIVRRSDVYRYLKYSAISFILSDCFTPKGHLPSQRPQCMQSPALRLRPR